ncbi:MAG: sigma-70 family RNA polymerase sigma factor [Austwickia sp.]|nr:sigma-70 family RNA polymerase sigma factor [Austwickia sp.]MBK8437284.1 sigma-70 family RNA polymerase sigma factor [Austwickia sp.]MBK9102518.1 sigma-70 family RNA polymerase sigma factor [Austwickia sp.]
MNLEPGSTPAEEFTRLYSEAYPMVLRYCRRRCFDEASARDATSETFATAWRRWHDVPPEALPWLYGVARRVVANQRRSEERTHRLIERLADEQRPGGATADTDFTALHLALASLSAVDQESLRLWAWEDLTVQQIAVAMQCRPATAAVRLHRARRRLRTQLGERDGPTTTAHPIGAQSWTR